MTQSTLPVLSALIFFPLGAALALLAVKNDDLIRKLTLVADPDCLLTEEKLVLELRGRGFDLIEFSDPVEFRYAYE